MKSVKFNSGKTTYSFKSGRVIDCMVVKGSSLSKKHYNEVNRKFASSIHIGVGPVSGAEKFLIFVDRAGDELLAAVACSYIHKNVVPLFLNLIPHGKLAAAALMDEKYLEINDTLDITEISYTETVKVISERAGRNNHMLHKNHPSLLFRAAW